MSLDINSIVTVGFPRSGNVFVNEYIHQAYATEYLLRPRHTGKSLSEFQHIIFPLRNPIDAMASYVVDDFEVIPIDQTIAYYLRFMKSALEHKNKLCVVNFELFTKNIYHISNQINDTYGIPIKHNISDTEVKEIIRSRNWTDNLPRDNREKLDQARKAILDSSKIDDCIKIYDEFIKASV